MRISVLVIEVLVILLLIPRFGLVYSDGQIEYTVQIDSEGSAKLTVIQVVDLNTSIDTLEDFRNKAASLVESARNQTTRDMSAETDSMSMMITIFFPSKTVEYSFYWKNFSRIENTELVVGDVFQVENFFIRLYGNGEVYITYPSQYVIETVSPLPNRRDDSLRQLKWFRTQDFMDGKPNIILRNKSLTQGFFEILQQNVIIISLAVIVAVSSGGFYVFKRSKKKEAETIKMPELTGLPRIESAEEKIVKVLKSSGGTLHQSAIVDQCKFSKAKTSQLLLSLEGKKIVVRYKKGRDKIVTLTEQDSK